MAKMKREKLLDRNTQTAMDLGLGIPSRERLMDTVLGKTAGYHGPKCEEDYLGWLEKLRGSGVRSKAIPFNSFADQQAWDLVRQDSSDAVEVYFHFLRINKRNVGVGRGSVPGKPDDYSQMYLPENAESGHEAFIDSLQHAGIFAFPTWWFSDVQTQWDAQLFREWTEGFKHPHPSASVYTPEYEKLLMSSPDPSDSERKLLARRHWRYNTEVGFPDKLPFRQTFVALEPLTNASGGDLIYQRRLNQSDTVGRYGCPTCAYSPEGELLPLDAIWNRGFLFDGELPGYRVIWALCDGYVFTAPHCPIDMPFLKIPMAVPLWVEMLGYTGKDVGPDHPGYGLPGRQCWICPDSLLPKPLTSLVAAIDDHRVIHKNFSRKHKTQRRKLKKDGIAVNQRRFQRVRMKSALVLPRRKRQSEFEDILPKWTLKSRVKVRSHERVYIRRGRLPLKLEDFNEMVLRGYRVYDGNKKMTFDDARRLRLRGSDGPGYTHWVAVKDVRIQEHYKGPEDGPEVKVVHIPSDKVVVEAIEWEMTDGIKVGK